MCKDELALQMAAQCGVSGTLAEWPYLFQALRNRGYSVSEKTSGINARKMARESIESIK